MILVGKVLQRNFYQTGNSQGDRGALAFLPENLLLLNKLFNINLHIA
jgi:hypothetical protein